jgi:hydrogenase expression/formation protein HypD
MKYVNEYRDEAVAQKLANEIRHTVKRPWVVMEICGGQTHGFAKYGLDRLLPPELELVHGPGCPVCVTPLETIDKAQRIAEHPDVIFCAFADMLRVPGSRADLLVVKSRGADVRMVYSPLDCLKIAKTNPAKQVVFFAVGFETTAPANAMAIWQAKVEGLRNLSFLVSHSLVPPVMVTILQSSMNRVQAFLGPGHVCAVMGFREYELLAARYRVPIVITGFEPTDLLEGILRITRQLEAHSAKVENQYSRVVSREGNRAAQDIIHRVFDICDRKWRGLGSIPRSGYKLNYEYREHDAEQIFQIGEVQTQESPICISGMILKGIKKPHDCPAFGEGCTPENPFGATMVSSEGACAAYYAYRRRAEAAHQ